MNQGLPNNIEAEKALLGSVFWSFESLQKACEEVEKEMFYLDSHAKIFEVISYLYDKKEPVDINTLTTELVNRKLIDTIGGVNYLNDITSSVATGANIGYYINIVVEKYTLRRMIEVATNIVKVANTPEVDVATCVEDAEKSILSVSKTRRTTEFRNVQDVLSKTQEDLEMLAKNKGKVTGLTTGLIDLDNLTEGLKPTQLIIVAARPAVGKTAFALNIGCAAAKSTKKNIAIFSLEMPAEQLVMRMISSLGQIDNKKLSTGRMETEDWRRVNEAISQLSDTKIFFHDAGGVTASEIKAKCRRLSTQGEGLGLVIIDYLQLIDSSARYSGSRQQEVSEISRSLKTMALELEVPVIALSQLSRSVEKREDKKPVLSDLRESGSIEQDADIVAALHAPEVETPNDDSIPSPIQLIILKHRNGPTATIDMLFKKEDFDILVDKERGDKIVNKKMSLSLTVMTVIICVAIILLGVTSYSNKVPTDAYVVYLDGKKIGTVESKNEFDNFINNKEDGIRKRYLVDTIYPPKGVEIKKVTTYDNKINTDEEIYNKITESKKFSIEGVVVTIEDEDNDEKEVINVLNKDVFDEAMETTIKAFIDHEKYQQFLEGTQEEIKDTGSIIENIDVKEKITYKNDLINVDEKIFIDVDELSKYLLYGTLEKQDTYTVQEGDTIEEVANANKLNVAEFLIANPQFSSANNLLYATQEVVVGLIDPLISVVVEYHSVEEEERPYEVEIKYDENQLKGYENVERKGENGLYHVTRKYQYVNGQLEDTATVSSEELKPAVSEILVKGDKFIPEVADLSYWAWPTARPYVITTYFQYRWGSFHSAIDIAGTGFGSDIYAANNGVVYEAKGGCSPGNTGCNGARGNYIIINHNAGGYYTQYMHLSSILVSKGQTVARGQKIAKMGNTGFVVPTPSSYSPYAGTHLDFSVYIGVPYRGGRAINPLGLY